MRSISFVICTYDKGQQDTRLAEVISSLRRQRGVIADIILVWQGREPARAPQFEGVKVIAVELASIAASRNIGASHAQADIICFLDDDTHPSGDGFSLEVIAQIETGGCDFITCNIASSGSIMSGEAVKQDVVLNRKSVIPHMWEPGLTVRKQAFEKVRFDSTLGIACLHGSSEGFDFGYRMLKAGFNGRRVASILVDHPPLDGTLDYRAERAFFYSLGNGAVLIQHGYLATYVWQIAKAFARLLVSLLCGDRVRARASFIRILCMFIGPLLPRRDARILPVRSAEAMAQSIEVLY